MMHARQQAKEIKRLKAKIKDLEEKMTTKSDHFDEAKKVKRPVVRRLVSKIDVVALIFFCKNMQAHGVQTRTAAQVCLSICKLSKRDPWSVKRDLVQYGICKLSFPVPCPLSTFRRWIKGGLQWSSTRAFYRLPWKTMISRNSSTGKAPLTAPTRKPSSLAIT